VPDLVKPIKFVASAAPIEAPTPTVPPMLNAAEAATINALIDEALVASIRMAAALSSVLPAA